MLSNELVGVLVGAVTAGGIALISTFISLRYQNKNFEQRLLHERTLESRARRTVALETLVTEFENQSDALTTLGALCNAWSNPQNELLIEVPTHDSLRVLSEKGFRRNIWAIDDLKVVALLNQYVLDLAPVLRQIIEVQANVADGPDSVDAIFKNLYDQSSAIQLQILSLLASLNDVVLDDAT